MMNILRKDSMILLLSVLLVTFSILVGNTYIALAASVILALFTLMNRQAGLLLLILFVSLRPFLIEMNSGLKITGDLIIFALLIWTAYDNRKNLKNLFQFQVFELAFFAFLAVGIISALITGVELMAIILQVRAYILFYLVYYVVKRMDLTEAFKKRGILLTFVTAVILSIHGFVEKISDKTAFMPEAWQNWSLSNTNHIRVYGLLKGPNELALYLAIAFLISLALFNHFKGNKRWLFLAGLSTIGATFLLTYSRGAFLALFVFVIAYFVFFRNLKRLVPILMVTFVSAGLFYAVTATADFYQDNVLYAVDNVDGSDEEDDPSSNKNKEETGYNRYKEAFSEDTIGKSSADGRIYYVTKAIEVFKDHPIIGTGFGTFGGAATLAYSSPIYDEYEIGFNFYSDNQYILTLAETGIVGVLILTVFIVYLLLITIKIYKQSDRPLAITLVFFFVTMMVGGLVYNILENDTFMLYYFLALGFAFHRLKQLKH
ncbi:O-antigen ligase family protein [Mesobacillus sp. S13]|uniref:O-antigen ligase family protein n=1 Tax=Mesobacillus sp. S13 TaxID=2880221 RepID=UPI001CF21802|nr:O-antigen ligase family protein [Mesobacillus sp. S13]